MGSFYRFWTQSSGDNIHKHIREGPKVQDELFSDILTLEMWHICCSETSVKALHRRCDTFLERRPKLRRGESAKSRL